MQDTLPEWSKGVDSSSTSASCVGSNPTGVISRQHIWLISITCKSWPLYALVYHLSYAISHRRLGPSFVRFTALSVIDVLT